MFSHLLLRGVGVLFAGHVYRCGSREKMHPVKLDRIGRILRLPLEKRSLSDRLDA